MELCHEPCGEAVDVQNAVALPRGAPSSLSRIRHRVLVHSQNDREPSCFRGGLHGVHPGWDLLRRARSHRPLRTGLSRVPQSCADADSILPASKVGTDAAKRQIESSMTSGVSDLKFSVSNMIGFRSL